MNNRIQSLRNQTAKGNIDALLVTYPLIVAILLDFRVLLAMRWLRLIRQILITDFRYRIQSQQEAPDWSVVFHQGAMIKSLLINAD